ncbi:G protein-coupled glucose receptor regulating Gpa2-domain-containing protein, partial [Mariannaea sp. PMI_226]
MSLFAGSLSVYWFFRMRRSYRHDLIMLLIGSNMFQACWFFIFPTVELVHGPVNSDSKFCQASGFFLTLSITVSDLAIMLITIHTTLYIFRGKQGLYPFRKYAYTILVLCPVLMSSLAFLVKPAYVSTGQFCYLPVDPIWVRLVLSWAPRYVTFATILFCSLAIYIYVKILMARFGNVKKPRMEQSSVGSNFSEATTLRSRHSTQHTPSISSHRPLLLSLLSRPNSNDDRFRQQSVSTTSTLPVDLPTSIYTSNVARGLHQPTSPRVSHAGIDLAQYVRRQSSALDPSDTVVVRELSTLAEIHVYEPQQSSTVTKPPASPLKPCDTTTGLWNRSYEYPAESSQHRRASSLSNIHSTPDRGLENTGTTSSDTGTLVQPALNATGLVKTRETIRRQVKQVFIYPVVYVAIWALPFIVHLTGFGAGASFGVRVASVGCLSLHGLIDATIFSWKEKPWLHSRRKGSGFNLTRWRRGRYDNGRNTTAGRTREEMIVDGRLARQRRDREITERQQEFQAGRKAAVEWWDNDV